MVAIIVGGLPALEWGRIGPDTPIEFAYLTLLGAALVPIAILLVSTSVYLYLRPCPLPQTTLVEPPRVSILYTT